MEENNKPKKEKKKFNYTLFIEILGLLALAGCLFETIYQVIVYGVCDEWCGLICYVITVLLTIIFFNKTFVFEKKAFRNRMLIYIFSAVIFCIPNIIGEIIMYSNGKYLALKDVTKLVTNGYSLRSICVIRCFSEILLIAFLCAILAFIIEMMLRDNLKKGIKND